MSDNTQDNHNKDNNLLLEYARKAVTRHPHSQVEVALEFCQKACPDQFLPTASNDRLVKLGRRIRYYVQLSNDKDDAPETNKAKAGLALLVQECQILLQRAAAKTKVPRIRFGKTGLEMPIVTLGCMRFQQEWGPRITTMDQVGTDCQDNLVAILKQAIDFGMVHIETARGYGCSELQLGCALQQLFLVTNICREDLILQTKIPPNKDAKEFRKAVETSFQNLQVDTIEQLEWIFGSNNETSDDEGTTSTKKETCMDVIREYMDAGKIKHLGFSTHGATDFIVQCIETNVFDYVNLHYHYFGSYTASGGGHDGQGNLDALKLLEKKDMGRFIISPYDKGGRLYAPSKKLCSLLLPDMEPMTFKSLWLWNHHLLYPDRPQIHTFTVGAARPSDLDQPAVAAYLQAKQLDDALARTQAVTQRLDEARTTALGPKWVDSWWKGLVKWTGSPNYQVEHNQMVWIYNSIQAFGLYEFGKARYHSFEKNEEKWDDSKSPEENIAKNIGKGPWGFVPGRPLQDNADYSEDLKHVPAENLARVQEAEAFVYKWCRQKKDARQEVEEDMPVQSARSFFQRTFSVSAQMFRTSGSSASLNSSNRSGSRLLSIEDDENVKDKDDPEDKETMDSEWETAYDMRPWPDYPDQPSRE